MVHVSDELQLAMGLQEGHVSAGPVSFRYWPLPQAVHCEVVALVQVNAERHPFTGEHALHASAGWVSLT